MTTATVLAAGLAAAAGALVPTAPRRLRVRAAGRRPRADEPALLRLRPVLAALSFLGAWAFVGSTVGVLAGMVAAVLAWRVLGRAEGPGARRRRDELERDLPVAVQLLGACLGAGAATSTALAAVAEALPGAVAEELFVVRHRLELGTDPVAVWADVASREELRPLGRAMVRAHRSGASVRASVDALAVELAARSRARADVRARSVEVRSAAPLGLCFLPAFVLLGVLPLVVGVFAALQVFG